MARLPVQQVRGNLVLLENLRVLERERLRDTVVTVMHIWGGGGVVGRGFNQLAYMFRLMCACRRKKNHFLFFTPRARNFRNRFTFYIYIPNYCFWLVKNTIWLWKNGMNDDQKISCPTSTGHQINHLANFVETR